MAEKNSSRIEMDPEIDQRIAQQVFAIFTTSSEKTHGNVVSHAHGERTKERKIRKTKRAVGHRGGGRWHNEPISPYSN